MATRTSRKYKKSTKKTTSTTPKIESKIVDDPLSGFKVPQIKKLARRAEAKRIQKETYDVVRQLIYDRVNDLLRKILVFTVQNGRKTVELKDLQSALQSEGTSMMAGEQIASRIKKTKVSKKRTNKIPDEGSSESTKKKKRKLKPDTIAEKEIKKYQETSDSLLLTQKSFRDFVRSQTSKHVDVQIRFASDFFKMFQIIIEDYIVYILGKAMKAVSHANRKNLQKKDIEFALSMSE